ncbi:MAG: extracellular solute-binding protein [Chloroflexi bacterium]|nr:extracellular solute-binding protein [Chloroflexota bacterium]
MKRLMSGSIVIVLLAALVLASCAPKQAPATPAPAAPLPAANVPTVKPAAPSPEDAEWAKVIEAAKKEGRVTEYAYYFYGDVSLAVAKAFKEKYGIQVDYIVGRGAEFNARLATEQRTKQYTADIFDSSPSWVATAKQQGFTVSLTDLPVFRDKSVWAMQPVIDSPDGHLIAFAPNPLPVVANTNLVKPQDEPKSWYDLLDPKWKGKIGVNDPITSSGPDIIVSYMVNHKALDMEYFRRLGDQNLVYLLGGSKEGLEKTARAEIAFTIVGSSAVTALFLQQGAPVKPLDLKEGRPILTQPVTVIKNAPHPNAARVFINWLLSAEGQAVYAQAATMESVRKDVPSAMPKGWVPSTNPVVETLKDVNDSAQGFKDQIAARALKRK